MINCLWPKCTLVRMSVALHVTGIYFTFKQEALSVLPDPVLPWRAMGALRDNEEEDSDGGREEEGEGHHQWQ